MDYSGDLMTEISSGAESSSDLEENPNGSPEYGRPTYPHIERLIKEAATASSTWVTREEIINALLLDSETKEIVNRGAKKASWSDRKYAGNMVDWWSADYKKNKPEFESFRSSFARGEIDKKAAYWPLSLGAVPRVRKVWINNASWLVRDNFQSEICKDHGLHWNLWSTQMLPYGDIEKGDLVVTSWDETKYRKRRKLLGWVLEIDHVAKSNYDSHEQAFSIMKQEMPKALRGAELTMKSFLDHDYNKGKPDSGFLLAYTATPRFLLDQPRPEDLNLSSHGWRSWTETDLQQLRYQILANPPQRVWQVNNNKTAVWETASGLLFAPLRDPNGHRRSGYDALKDASPGDRVYSMFEGSVGATGVVVRTSRDLQPGEVSGGRTGPGYELQVQFQRLRSPFRPKEHFDEITEMMDPDMTQLTVKGDAVQPVYFGEIATSHGDVYDRLIRANNGLVGADRHLLVRLSGRQGAGPSTVDEYRLVLSARKKVALIKIGSPISDANVSFYSQLLKAGKKVSIFILIGSGENSLFESNLVKITNDPREVPSDLIPGFHAEHVKPGNTCFVLDSIETENLFDELDNLLVLYSDPASPISSSLKGQQNIMNVLKTSIETRPITGHPPIHTERVRVLADQLTWSEDVVDELLDGLENRRSQIILTGPPGTGKTYCADLIAKCLLSSSEAEGSKEDRIHVVQFHPTSSYQEFMEGLQPKPEGASFKFEWVDGVLKRIVEKIETARRSGNPGQHVLVVDEINRANVPSVLGELMYLLEYRDKSMTLSSGKTFKLPKELIIIGTMNSADRSIRGLDLALRRRFDFFVVSPDGEILRKFFGEGGKGKLEGISIDQLVSGFERLNQQIETDSQTSDLMIGHSYFMETKMSRQVLHRVWRQQLFPLIREYFLGNPDSTRKYSVESFWNP